MTMEDYEVSCLRREAEMDQEDNKTWCKGCQAGGAYSSIYNGYCLSCVPTPDVFTPICGVCKGEFKEVHHLYGDLWVCVDCRAEIDYKLGQVKKPVHKDYDGVCDSCGHEVWELLSDGDKGQLCEPCLTDR